MKTYSIPFVFLSLLSDSNQRPRDYKSRAHYIAPLQPSTLAAVKPWGIPREHAV